MKKENKLRNLIPAKVARIIFWVILSFIMIRGVVTIVRPSNSNIHDLDQNIRLVKEEMNTENEASSFAESFAKEFLSFKQGQGEEYRKRLSMYLTPQVLASINTSLSGDVLTEDSNTIKVKKVDDSKYNVDIKTKTKYPNTTKDIFLSVHVVENNGSYAIDEMPLFIAGPKIAYVEPKQMDEQSANSTISTAVEDMLNNFFKVYTEGADGEIAYYLNDPTIALSGLKGAFKFKSLLEVKVYETSVADEYTVVTNYTVEDPQLKQDIKQKIAMKIIKRDNRYYIKEFNIRL